LLVTSATGKANYLRAMEVGVDDFVAKPFDSDELAARVRVAERILGLQREVSKLEQLLPICSYCKDIRGNDDQWCHWKTI